ncbi:uncharacterized protein CTRU02_204883 [Colletotrichum truncatum]|uniref:Uncharacterized protein n=1 Tax=Colletotrichum truncatum TaxID=5467 RepID=A0ACC3Z2F9_COLTU
MKRKQNGEDGVATRPSPKRRTRDEPFRESESVREQARPYLLAVGRLHIDVLETTWSIGRNRRLEPGHVRELKEAFMKGGLERGAPENRIFVLCTAEEVYRIRRSRDNEDDNDDNDDNNNNDRLPADLDIKLRINRRDPSLPDNHGQIWTQLVSIASDTSGGSTKGGAAQVIVDYKLVEALRLGGEKSFPTQTFNISTFEWMASLRIDDYWLTTLEAALGTLKALPLDETQDLGQDD